MLPIYGIGRSFGLPVMCLLASTKTRNLTVQDRDIIFMETAKQLGDTRVHAVVEAVPVPRQAFAKAPIYFKKAVDDVSGEWSQHHAKRLIDTRAKVCSMHELYLHHMHELQIDVGPIPDASG